MISNFPRIVALAGLVAFGAGATGCSSSPMGRIDANRAVYESWPIDMQSAVLEGKVLKGMTPEMVKTALGKPTKVDVRSGSNGEDEIWVYEKGGGMSGLKLPGNVGLGIGGSIGPVGVSTS